MITTKQNIYLLKFRNSSEEFVFQTDEHFLEILKLPNAKHGVEQVRILNNKMKFVYFNKKELRRHFSYNTEIIETLNKIKF